jgi:hypothetical protein
MYDHEAAIYRGIRFSLRALGHAHWHWEIFPPFESVRGFKLSSGKVSGGMMDAITAAKKEIDRQSNRQPKTANEPLRGVSGAQQRDKCSRPVQRKHQRCDAIQRMARCQR